MKDRIKKVLRAAKTIEIDDWSKLVFLSDCHRGYGDSIDVFAKNHNAYITALRHYYNNGFTYFELGDGDELWVNSEFRRIVGANAQTFKLMMKFHEASRLFLIYGNHDGIKKNKKWVNENLRSYFDSRKNKVVPMFPGIDAHEGLLLSHDEGLYKILLLHGHQADFLNDTLAPLTKLLVRYLWRPLEAIGVKDPTSASVSAPKMRSVETALAEWAKRERIMLIAGHTHRTVFPAPGDDLYFNDGCCVAPRHITAIELEKGLLTLVKWSVEARSDGILQVIRNTVAGPYKLSDYFGCERG